MSAHSGAREYSVESRRPSLYFVATIDAALEDGRIHRVMSTRPEVYLLPSREAADYARRRLGRALGTHLLTFYDLGWAILDEAGVANREIGDLAAQRLVGRLMAGMAEREELSTFATVWQKPGFVQVLVRWLSEMKSQGIDPEKVETHARTSGRERDRQLATLYRRYQAYLQAGQYSDADGLLWLAVEEMERRNDLYAGPVSFRVLGFDQFTPIQLRILGLLAARIDDFSVSLLWDGQRSEDSPALARLRITRDELARTLPGIDRRPPAVVDRSPLTGDETANGVDPVLIHLRRHLFEPAAPQMPVGSPPGVEAIAAPSRESEVRQALRGAKELLQAGISPEEIAILAPHPAAYRRLVETVAEEYRIPVRHERALRDNPAVAALLNLLSLFPAEYPWRETFDALRSPYFRQSWLTDDQIDLLDRLTRERPVVAGREQWRFALQPLALGESGVEDEDRADLPLVAQMPADELNQIERGLLEFFDHIESKEAATYWEYTRWIQEAILGLFPAGVGEGDPPGEGQVTLNMIACCREGAMAGPDMAALVQVTKILRELLRAAEQVPPQKGNGPAVYSESSSTIDPSPLTVSWSQYRAELAALLLGWSIPPDPALGGLRFGSLSSGRGTVVDTLFVLGLSEGEFPQPPAPDPIYAPAERARRHEPGALPLRYQDPAEDASLWWQILSGVRRRLTLIRPRIDENGAPWLPSPYWIAALAPLEGVKVEEPPVSGAPAVERAGGPAELLLAQASGEAWGDVSPLGLEWETARRSAQRAAAVMVQRSNWDAPGSFEGVIQAPDLQAEMERRYGLDHAWSPSRLNRYGNCPYGYFAQSILGLEERPDPDEGFDALQRGSLLHEVLEAFYRRLVAKGLAPTLPNKEAVLDQLEASCDVLFPGAPDRYGFRPGPLWRYEQEELRRLLRSLANWECEQNGSSARFRPFLQEVRFGISGGRAGKLRLEDEGGTTFYLHGVIDRLDLDEEGMARVIDYKSGGTAYSRNDVSRGLATQVALYALAAEELLPEIELVAESAYLHIPSRKTSAGLAFEGGAAQDGQVLATVASAAFFVRQVRAGLFPSAPAKPAAGATACRAGCGFASLCRVSRASIAKARRMIGDEGA